MKQFVANPTCLEGAYNASTGTISLRPMLRVLKAKCSVKMPMRKLLSLIPCFRSLGLGAILEGCCPLPAVALGIAIGVEKRA